MNYNVGNPYLALAFNDYWERKDAEANRLNSTKINASVQNTDAIKAWVKKLFARDKETQCIDKTKCNECGVCA